MFPLLLVFVTVLGYVAHDDPGLRRDLLDTALADFPVVGQELRRNIGAELRRIAASVSKTTSTIFGARPSEGSSSISRRGALIIARASATIC